MNVRLFSHYYFKFIGLTENVGPQPVANRIYYSLNNTLSLYSEFLATDVFDCKWNTTPKENTTKFNCILLSVILIDLIKNHLIINSRRYFVFQSVVMGWPHRPMAPFNPWLLIYQIHQESVSLPSRRFHNTRFIFLAQSSISKATDFSQ